MPYFGEILSLSVAVLWGLAMVLFKKSGERVHPVALNTFKNVLASVLFLVTIYLFGGTLFEPFSATDYILLAISGIVGIAIGDTLLFASLNIVGAGPTALINCLYSPFIIGLSYLFLAEVLSPLQLVGVAMIVAAVLETGRASGPSAASGKRRALGITLGVLGNLAMAIGVVMVKPILNNAPLLWAVEIRLLAGVAVLLIFLLLNPRRHEILRTLRHRDAWRDTVLGSFLGGYVAMMGWLGGIKFTKASIAGALNQTNVVFIIIFAAILLRERISASRWLAIVVALAGAFLVTFG